MGQTQHVNVHRLLATDTVDERLRELVGMKAEIFEDYARESAVKSESPSSIDDSVRNLQERILQLEVERYQQRQLVG